MGSTPPGRGVHVNLIARLRKFTEEQPQAGTNNGASGSGQQSGTLTAAPDSFAEAVACETLCNANSGPEVVDLTLLDSEDESSELKVRGEEEREGCNDEDDDAGGEEEDMDDVDWEECDELMEMQLEEERTQVFQEAQLAMPEVKVEQQLSVSRQLSVSGQSSCSSTLVGGSMVEFCAAVQTCPECTNGEVRVLGHTLLWPAYMLFLKMLEEQGHGMHLHTDSHQHSVCAQLKRMIQNSLDAGEKMVQCRDLLLPEDIECKPLLCARLIDASDSRRALVGQRGVFAVKDIAPGCLLGPYRSLALPTRFFNHFTKHPPPRWGTYAQGKCSHPAKVWEYLVNSYSADVDYVHVKSQSSQDSSQDEQGKAYHITMSAFGYGNISCLVNDHHTDPWRLWDEDDCSRYLFQLPYEAKEEYKEARLGPTVANPNVDIETIYVNGFPFLFLISKEHIRAGEELLYDYGYLYWECLKPLSDSLDAADMAFVNKIMSGN
eukprot:evm.model.scf_501.3 EVM.evm.TU.scf_501.3   scf_501:33313-34782(+)